MKKIVCIIAALCAMLGTARAQSSSDFGTWSSVQLVKSWGKPYAMARLEHRSYENAGATECWFAMAGAGCKLNNWLKADLSYEYWQVPSAGDLTMHKIVACATGTLKRDALAVSVREKYELAFNAAGGSPSGTLRSRFRAQYGLSKTLTPYFMYEFFNGFSGKGWIRSLHYFGTEIKLADHHSLDLFYMYHLYPAAGDLAACNLLGAGYFFTF